MSKIYYFIDQERKRRLEVWLNELLYKGQALSSNPSPTEQKRNKETKKGSFSCELYI
jgi:hypothetical protein